MKIKNKYKNSIVEIIEEDEDIENLTEGKKTKQKIILDFELKNIEHYGYYVFTNKEYSNDISSCKIY